MKQEIIDRLAALRKAMADADINATIIPKTDPHQSEYLADHWQVIRWLTGFTGSAATVVVTRDEALFWTDSRYFLQAAEQLDGTTIKLMKDGLPETPSINEYLLDHLAEGDTIGIDGMLFSINATRELAAVFNPRGINLAVDFAPFDILWTSRPELPANPIFIHDIKYAGESAPDKMRRILANVEMQGARSTFICDLAEIAWTLNIRCNDVDCNPVATAFLMVAPGQSTLFINTLKLTDETRRYLTDCNVDIKGYDAAAAYLSSLPADACVLLSASQAAGAFMTLLGDRAVIGTSPVAMLKACKNDVQIDGVRHAMVRDGVALVKSFMEIEERMEKGIPTTEMDIADILFKYRSAQPLFYTISFDTIAGYGPHGAIVHYSATPESNSTLRPDNLLLVDSGASYLDGTTDITRTITLGNTTAEQRRDFTLVMKGHIALATAIYPVGTRGAQLDVLARQYLWKQGLSYLHGTGHGVGHFLNVHEGPQSIRLNDTLAPMTPGMITSNEPGLYRSGEHGIRCENLVLTVKAMTTEFGEFLKFETLTLFPFDLRLFDTTIMTDEEIAWVNSYHAIVWEHLSPALNDSEKTWLRAKTAELKR